MVAFKMKIRPPEAVMNVRDVKASEEDGFSAPAEKRACASWEVVFMKYRSLEILTNVRDLKE